MSRKLLILCYCTVGGIIMSLVYFLTVGFHEDELKLDAPDEVPTADKWIVVTTIQSPTTDVRKLSALHGWKMVVVGDRKTPANWSLPGVVYLDVAKQNKLKFSILKHLPINTYVRKSIGYLYAIQHGAKYIYETDDDNYPTYGLSFQVSENAVPQLVLSTNNLTSNPYVHFGQSSLWPRGYPHDRIGLPTTRHYHLCETPTPPIQQGVVDGDPDVDALFRLTRREASTPIKLTFDHAAPPLVLPPRTYAPTNSQNTFFLYRALWSLVFPVSVSDREADIYRGYWAQRLLWLIGDGIAFTPPNAVQVRNAHSYLKDARDEDRLYHQMPLYIRSLDTWQCAENIVSFFECVSRLSHHLVKDGFWESRDADTVDAWLADLIAVGYSPPELSRWRLDTTCKSQPEGSRRWPVVFYPVEQTTTVFHSKERFIPPASTNHELILREVEVLCGPAHRSYYNTATTKTHKYQNILLVISIPDNVQSVLPGLETFYRLHFPNIIYCVKSKVDDEFINKWKISLLWLPLDVSAIPCLLAARKIQFGVHGVLHISANMLLNAGTHRSVTGNDSLDNSETDQQLTQSLCTSKAITCRNVYRDLLTKASDRITHSKKLTVNLGAKLKACISKIATDTSSNGAVWISDMALYVPIKQVDSLEILRDELTPESDILVAHLFACAQSEVVYMKHAHGVNAKLVNTVSSVDYFLPFDFNRIDVDAKLREPLCSYYEWYK